MRVHSVRVGLLAALLLAVVAVPARATAITVASDPALVGSTLIDFDSEPDATFATKTFSGVTFTGIGGNLSIAAYTSGGIYGGSGQDLETIDVIGGGSLAAFRIDFANPVSAFGTVWGGANQDWTVRLFNSSNALIETLVFLGGDGGQASYVEFYGATGTDIKFVTFDIIPGVSGTDWVKLDNFQFVSAAAPQSPSPSPPRCSCSAPAWASQASGDG